MTERVVEGGRDYILHFLTLEVQCPALWSRILWVCWALAQHRLDVRLSTDSVLPRDEPGPEESLVGDEKGSGGPGSPSSPPLLLVFFAYITYGCGNLEPHKAVESTGSLELVVFGIVLPGRLGALQGRKHIT